MKSLIQFLMIMVGGIGFTFAEASNMPSTLESGEKGHYFTPESYKGKLHCKTLDETLAALPDARPRIYCQYTQQDCETVKLFNGLDPKNPLWQDLYGRLFDKTVLSLEICELTIAHYAPDYYERHLKR